MEKALQAAQQAYFGVIKQYKPENPRNPNYQAEYNNYQKLLSLPRRQQAKMIQDTRASHGKGRNNSDNAELERVKKELAKVNADAGKEHEAAEKVKKDFAELEKKYKELDGKLKANKRTD